MAKEAPTLTVTIDDAGGSGEAISNDVTNLSIVTPRGVQDVTGVNSPAVERLLLLADGTLTLNGVGNFAASPSAHDVFYTVGPTSVARTCVVVTSGKTFTMEGHAANYDIARGNDGSLTWTAALQQTTTTAPTWSG